MLLFVDESGTDRREAPYEVLAGVAIRERNLWPLIQAIRAAERDHFGVLLSEVGVEFKGKTLLKSRVFKHAAQESVLPPVQRTTGAHEFLQKGVRRAQGENVAYRRHEFTAYGQAVLDFVREVFALCGQFGVRVFASMMPPDAPRPATDFLRKDYAYLFERFFYYLEDMSSEEMGIVVFDEIDRILCVRLLKQMEAYFLVTHTGRQRSSRIVPEPFFVHSDLTTAVQLADLVAYTLNWGLRLNRMERPIRPEMEEFGQLAFNLRYVGQRAWGEEEQFCPVYGLTYIDDLRPHEKRLEDK